jgi:hypothetical protein
MFGDPVFCGRTPWGRSRTGALVRCPVGLAGEPPQVMGGSARVFRGYAQGWLTTQLTSSVQLVALS